MHFICLKVKIYHQFIISLGAAMFAQSSSVIRLHYFPTGRWNFFSSEKKGKKKGEKSQFDERLTLLQMILFQVNAVES